MASFHIRIENEVYTLYVAAATEPAHLTPLKSKARRYRNRTNAAIALLEWQNTLEIAGVPAPIISIIPAAE